ncbi:MAG TPA: response regulator [Methylomirabilota bacterium]|nr:response regulator [Methylomirabilota bacterium]
MKKSNPTILIIEDNLDDQFLIERALRKSGVTDPIHLLSDGDEAIKYMMGEGKFSDRHKYAYPTFILTDLKMMRMDGFAVLEFLKSNPEWAVIPTIVMSSSADLDDIKKAYMLGASSYHVKPRTHGALMHQMKVLHEYWMTCEVPEVDSTGRQVRTNSEGKLGERFPQAGDAGKPSSRISRKTANAKTKSSAS